MRYEYSASEVEDMLRHIDPNCARATWFSVAGAIKDYLGDTGSDLFIDWSKTGQGYNEADAKATWRSASPGHYTIGTVIKLAQDGGWHRKGGRWSAEEKRALGAEREARRKVRQAEIEADAARLVRMQEAVAEACRTIWDQHTHHLGQSEYLGTKGVRAHGVRFFKHSVLLVIDDRKEQECCEVLTGAAVRQFFQGLPKPRPEHLSFLRMTYGSIAVPLRDAEGTLWCLQVINAQGTKLFPKYSRKKGCFHLLGQVSDGPLGFAEGYATAATAHELTGWPVVACVDSGNMAVVADAILPGCQGVEPVWLADNDAPNPKTGKQAGQEAAERCRERHGGIVLPPVFPDAEAA